MYILSFIISRHITK